MDEIVCDICNSPIKRKKDLPRHKRSEFCQKVNELLNKFQNTNFTKINLLEEEVKKLQDKILLLEKENTMNKEKAEEYR